MGRAWRIEYEGGLYHVLSRMITYSGESGLEIFSIDMKVRPGYIDLYQLP